VSLLVNPFRKRNGQRDGPNDVGGRGQSPHADPWVPSVIINDRSSLSAMELAAPRLLRIRVSHRCGVATIL